MTEREEKWPKGPWYSVVDDIDGAIELTCDARSQMVPLAKIDMGFTDAFEETQRAALKLMESAPALYKALERLLKAYEDAVGWGVDMPDETRAAEEYANNILSQARGETGEEG